MLDNVGDNLVQNQIELAGTFLGKCPPGLHLLQFIVKQVNILELILDGKGKMHGYNRVAPALFKQQFSARVMFFLSH